MSTIIRLKENEKIAQMFELLQNTIYCGLDKTEIIRAILAEKTWSIKTQMSANSTTLELTETKIAEIEKKIDNYYAGKSKTTKIKNSKELTTFLDKLAN